MEREKNDYFLKPKGMVKHIQIINAGVSLKENNLPQSTTTL